MNIIEDMHIRSSIKGIAIGFKEGLELMVEGNEVIGFVGEVLNGGKGVSTD